MMSITARGSLLATLMVLLAGTLCTKAASQVTGVDPGRPKSRAPVPPPDPFVPSSPNALPQLVPTTGTDSVALFVCVADHTVPMTRTVQDVYEDILDPDDPESFATYMAEQSYGAYTMAGDVFGLYDLGSAKYSGDLRAAVAAQASASGDVTDWSVYRRVIIVTPSADTNQVGVSSAWMNTVCFGQPWNPVSYPDMPGFLGTITFTNFGELPLAVQDYTIQPSSKIGWFMHEYGHALGLGHERNLECGTVWYDEQNYTKTSSGVGMMPIGNNRHATMLEKEYMRWLDPGQVQTIDSNGVYEVHLRAVSQAKAPGEVQLLKILRAVCSNPSDVDDVCGGDQFGWYYVEYRRPKGFDAHLFNTPWTPSGATTSMDGPQILVNAFRDIGNTTPHTGARLDMSPAGQVIVDSHWSDMDHGVLYVDPVFGTTLRLLSADADEAVIEVIATGL